MSSQMRESTPSMVCFFGSRRLFENEAASTQAQAVTKTVYHGKRLLGLSFREYPFPTVCEYVPRVCEGVCGTRTRLPMNALLCCAHVHAYWYSFFLSICTYIYVCVCACCSANEVPTAKVSRDCFFLWKGGQLTGGMLLLWQVIPPTMLC